DKALEGGGDYFRWAEYRLLSGCRISATAIRAMGVTRVPEATLRQNLNVLTLPRGMKVTVGALFSVNFAIFLAATIDPVSTGRWFGAGDLFMLAAGAWVA